ncbi:MAG: transposase, partial [Planctomyces sp.]
SLAWQHYIAGLSLDTVIGEFEFYWNLTLRKSQADRMLNRLAKEWLPEFDALCQLLAVSAVVYADETSWSINSVWAFLSEHSRITVFGCHKDGETLAVLLKKEEFKGILVSDDAAVYQGFSLAQKCWAHLLRKAIRLTLLKPDRPQYKEFLDALLEIYRKGKAIASDKRLTEASRCARVEQLVDAVCDCTGARFADETKPTDEAEKDFFFDLTHEIVRLMSDDELFTFVIHPEADGTNNISERQLRDPAQDRATGQTNKTERGARRRTVITSVLDSLRAHVPKLTLKTALEELNRWQQTGISCFRRLVNKLKLPALNLPDKIQSPLELLVPLNDTG